MNSIKNLKDDFFNYGITFWEKSTEKYYIRNLDFFFNFLEEEFEKDLNDIDCLLLDKHLLHEYILYLRMKTKTDGTTLKANTIRTYMRAVKSLLNYGYVNKYFNDNLTFKLKLPKSEDVQIIPLLQSEYNLINNSYSESFIEYRNKVIFNVMINCGLRVMEICNIKVKDINFESHFITVYGKGKKSRIVPITLKLEKLIKNYISKFSCTDFLFTKMNSFAPINSNCIRSMFNTIRARTKVDRIHPHLLRHTFATSFIMGGGNLENLRLLLGHYDYAVTKQYLHLAGQFNILHYDIFKLDMDILVIHY